METKQISVSEIGAAVATEDYEAAVSALALRKGKELYTSPDGKTVLELTERGEQRFGAQVFTAKLTSNGHRKRIRGLFQSPGRFGLGYDHFSGNPFSPDSNKLVLITLADMEAPRNGLRGLDAATAGSLFNFEIEGPVLPHSWSAGSKWWLAQSYARWLVVDAGGAVRHLAVPEEDAFPKHAAFVADGTSLLTFTESSCQAQVYELPSLEAPASYDLDGLEPPFFSFPSALDEALVLGSGVRFGESLSALTWLKIELLSEGGLKR